MLFEQSTAVDLEYFTETPDKYTALIHSHAYLKEANMNKYLYGGDAHEYSKDIKEKIEDTADTIEILEDEILMSKIRQSIKDIEEGRTIPIENVRAELGL